MSKHVAAMLAAAAMAVVSAAAGPRAASGALVVPELNSLPGANAKLFLDFDGDVQTGNYGIYQPGTTPAYSLDGDLTSFSVQEEANIHWIWSAVAEKFSPFNLNVTTVDPGNRDNLVTMAIVIGGNGSWAPAGSGGIAPWSAFMGGDPNWGYVFPANLQQNPAHIAESAAHEAGHGFGLHHQSVYNPGGVKTAEYNPGDSDRAPIMGVSYYAKRGQWWRGPNPISSGNIQDDLRVLSGVGSFRPNFNYRPDDHPSSADVAADPLTVSDTFEIAGHGVIERSTDADWFRFTTPGGVANLYADVNPEAPMLDLSLSLYDAGGSLLASRATGSWGEHLSLALSAGEYRLMVSGAGGYGDVGQYFLSGTVVPEPSSLAAAAAILLIRLGRRNRL